MTTDANLPGDHLIPKNVVFQPSNLSEMTVLDQTSSVLPMLFLFTFFCPQHG